MQKDQPVAGPLDGRVLVRDDLPEIGGGVEGSVFVLGDALLTIGCAVYNAGAMDNRQTRDEAALLVT